MTVIHKKYKWMVGGVHLIGYIAFDILYIYISILATKETPPYCRKSRDRIDFGLTKYQDQKRKEFIVYQLAAGWAVPSIGQTPFKLRWHREQDNKKTENEGEKKRETKTVRGNREHRICVEKLQQDMRGSKIVTINSGLFLT